MNEKLEKVLLQLERLHRHYTTSVQFYDHVSLLDLSHSLRIWADLKSDLPSLGPAFETTLAFKTATPVRKVMRAVRGSQFVLAYMPGAVITYANQGHIASGPHPNSPFTIGASSQFNADGSMELQNYCFVTKAFEQPLIWINGASELLLCYQSLRAATD